MFQATEGLVSSGDGKKLPLLMIRTMEGMAERMQEQCVPCTLCHLPMTSI